MGFYHTLICFLCQSFYHLIHNFLLRQHTYFMKKQKRLPDIGAVLFSLALSPRELLPDSFSKKYKKNHPIITVLFLSALLGSGLELVIGWFPDFFLNLRYWDYNGYFLNFRWYICLASAFGFGLQAFCGFAFL